MPVTSEWSRWVCSGCSGRWVWGCWGVMLHRIPVLYCCVAPDGYDCRALDGCGCGAPGLYCGALGGFDCGVPGVYIFAAVGYSLYLCGGGEAPALVMGTAPPPKRMLLCLYKQKPTMVILVITTAMTMKSVSPTKENELLPVSKVLIAFPVMPDGIAVLPFIWNGIDILNTLKMYEICWRFFWNLFLRIELTIFQFG